MNLYLLITCLFFLHIAVSNCKVCTSSEGVVKCCQGYLWNKIDNRCIPIRGHTECDAGTFGPKCEHVCTYPHYGKLCLPKCNCSKDHCSPVNGCDERTINASTSSQTSHILRSTTSLIHDYSESH
uniref:Uncharacterized protein n=1 Tax=Magallana gigas TaxID=29159 RepID=A0A8W8JCK9_MAGGI